MDYFSTGKLDPAVAEDVVRGFAKACKENGCALIGGETAEMPDLYSEGEYDLAGMIVGVVEKDEIIDGRLIESGDILIGLPSTGLHTNGYSLARKVLFETTDVTHTPPELGGRMVGDVLLDVHRSYLHAIRTLVEAKVARGLVHVTGGGIPGNTARVVPDGLTFNVDYDSWKRPAIFDLIQQMGNVPEEDMRRTFNLGIGLIAIVASSDVDRAVEQLKSTGEQPIPVGTIG